MFWNAIQKYGWKNFEHFLWVENVSKEEALLFEKFLIGLFDTTNPIHGYNLSTGGESGASGTKWSAESRMRHSAVLRKKWSTEQHYNLGRKAAPETKAKLSAMRKGHNNPNYGKTMSDEQKRKISIAHSGKRLSIETRNKLVESHRKNRKSVLCVETGVIYDSLTIASKDTGARRDHISECCRFNTKRKTAAGFHWQYCDKGECNS